MLCALVHAINIRENRTPIKCKNDRFLCFCVFMCIRMPVVINDRKEQNNLIQNLPFAARRFVVVVVTTSIKIGEE